MPLPLIPIVIAAGLGLAGTTKGGQNIIKGVGKTAINVGKKVIKRTSISFAEKALEKYDEAGIELNGYKPTYYARAGAFNKSLHISIPNDDIFYTVYENKGYIIYAIEERHKFISNSQFLLVGIVNEFSEIKDQLHGYLRRQKALYCKNNGENDNEFDSHLRDEGLICHYNYFGEDEEYTIINKNYNSNDPNSKKEIVVPKRAIIYALCRVLQYKYTSN